MRASLRVLPAMRMAAVLIVASLATWTGMARASADTRSLDIYHMHTGEHEVITFKRDGVYDPVGLDKLNHILRDWRRNEVVRMDPELFDLLWTVYRETGATGAIQIVCGYRAPETNNMLRSRSRGVAKFSQHTLGKAIDFYLQGVPLEKLRETGMKHQVGGVGFYPTSGSPFVHMDTGSVRAWPRMSRDQLVRLFPDGKTLHLPSDGGPLPGYQQALAEYQAHRGGQQTQVADASPGSRGRGNLLASLFGVKSAEDEEETSAPASTPQKAQAPARLAQQPAPLPTEQQPAKPVVMASLPMPPARNPLLDQVNDATKPQFTPVSLTVANVPMPPPAAPRNAGAIWPGRTSPQPSADAIAALKAIDVPPPPVRPSNVVGNVPKPRPAAQVASLTGSRSIEDAFSALTGTPRDETASGVLGYAPAAAPQMTDRAVSAPRDPAGRLKLASLGGSDVAPAGMTPQKSTRAGDEMASKSNRADQMARLVSPLSEKIDLRLLETTSASRSASVARLTHPDQKSVMQMIVKPREVLAASAFSTTGESLATGRFVGPAVVALAIVETR
jgi:uncharacterized protein YcbK (DUF882 family)